jgi:hypothetical protein
MLAQVEGFADLVEICPNFSTSGEESRPMGLAGEFLSVQIEYK